MPVTPPGTVSPGRLLILYHDTFGLEHNCGANFKLGVDFDDIAAIRTEAEAFATAAMDMCLSSSAATGWRITDIDGVFLYEESFDDPIPGGVTPDSGDISSQSTTLGARGKGVGPTVGTGVGTTRTFVFTGFLQSTGMLNSLWKPGDAGYNSTLIDYLNGSLIVGADRYGQGANYKDSYTVQINAHVQKRYGL